MSGHARRPSKTSVFALVKAHDYAAVTAVLKAFPEAMDYRGNKGESLLHLCCGVQINGDVARAKASVKTAQVLIDAGIDINEAAFKEGDWKATPLWYAIGRGKNLKLAAPPPLSSYLTREPKWIPRVKRRL